MQAKYNRQGGRPRGRAQNRDYNRLRAVRMIEVARLNSVQQVYLVDEDYKTLEKQYNKGVVNKILALILDWVQLALGVLGYNRLPSIR